MSQAILDRITIFPIKSLDGMELESALISEGGCLLHDRELAITDEMGIPINGKNNAQVHALLSYVDFSKSSISFSPRARENWQSFIIPDELKQINTYLSEFFGMPAFIHQNKRGRFLDIPDISGATLISTETLQAVTQWFPGMDIVETRNRFRATLEIKAVTAFWEDYLFAGSDEAVEYRIGEVTLFGMSPRARCIVPTRHPTTGESWPGFAKSFNKHRGESIPAWSRLSEYGNHYFLTVDSLLPPSEVGKTIRRGDKLEIVGVKKRI